ncbi:MAG: DUF4249 domain-containing protein [Bacteroidales bacterium]|nr:DUF4249 domain-containing protein [Bacteroidales bacterium]
MKTHYKLIFSILTIAFLFTSCTEEIDLELNDSFTRLVVEGNIGTDTIHQKIRLTKSTSYFYNQEPPVIQGASVKVSDGTTNYIFIEDPNIPGYYFSENPFSGIPGKTYSLDIQNVVLEQNGAAQSYKAEEPMKQILVIDSIYAVRVNVFGMDGYIVYGFAQEPATPKDYYMWRYYVNNRLITDTINKVTFGSDELVNGNYLSNLELGFFTEGKPGDTLTVETNTITEEYYEFIVTFIIETQFSGGGFTGPPANIITNISNGAVGYFNTEARSKISTVLP